MIQEWEPQEIHLTNFIFGEARLFRLPLPEGWTLKRGFSHPELHATHWRSEQGGDIHAFAETASDFFDKDPQQASAALFRMQALARLVRQEPLPGWISEAGEDGRLLIDERLFAAVAETPLSLRQGRVVFNRDRLLQTAFALGSRTRTQG